MGRIACWIMISGLMMSQAHGLVAHHHHVDDAPAHRHAADHHAGFDHHAEHGPGHDESHPEVAPHDEPSLSNISTSHSRQFELVIVLPDSVDFVLPCQVRQRQRKLIAASHPYATGPPGTKSSRAPPASLTA